MSKPTTRGFTLIELLVVIAIIGLLSSVVLASLNTARAKARDAVRKSDMGQLQLALEYYYDANKTYPGAPTTLVTSDLASLKPSYIAAVPADPQDPGAHSGASGYRYTGNANGYVIMALLESTNTFCQVSAGTAPNGWPTAYPHC
ncbi:prepilin-type N-terminal cleavage/methylation domain-containing protein [soil metagenome]